MQGLQMFTGDAYPQTQEIVQTPGQTQGVYITIHADNREVMYEKMQRWFAGRDEVDFVDTGISDKIGLGYIILEWIECSIDALFLSILQDEEVIGDYTVYVRDVEQEG